MVLWVCVAFSIVQSFSSCISTKGTTYFNDLPDSALIKLIILSRHGPLYR